MRFTISIIALLTFFLPVDVQAREFEREEAPRNTSMEEFKDVKPGLLLPTAAPKVDAVSLEPVIPINLPGIKAPVDITLKPMTMNEVNKEYRLGNYKKIIPALELLARTDHHAAQELLAIALKAGYGVEKNPKKSLELMTKAAESNRPLAQHYLGVMYFTGEGLEAPDAVRSLMWLQIAIVHYEDGPSKARAMQDRDSVSARLSRREKERAREMARNWLDKKGEGHLLDLR